MSPRVFTIMKEVASAHGLPVYELWCAGRTGAICAARHEAIAIIRAIPGRDGRPKFSTPQIGAFFHRDHSTIVDSLRRSREAAQEQQQEAA